MCSTKEDPYQKLDFLLLVEDLLLRQRMDGLWSINNAAAPCAWNCDDLVVVSDVKSLSVILSCCLKDKSAFVSCSLRLGFKFFCIRTERFQFFFDIASVLIPSCHYCTMTIVAQSHCWFSGGSCDFSLFSELLQFMFFFFLKTSSNSKRRCLCLSLNWMRWMIDRSLPLPKLDDVWDTVISTSDTLSWGGSSLSLSPAGTLSASHMLSQSTKPPAFCMLAWFHVFFVLPPAWRQTHQGAMHISCFITHRFELVKIAFHFGLTSSVSHQFGSDTL